MANQYLQELTEETAPVETDQVPVTDNATQRLRRMSLDTLRGFLLETAPVAGNVVYQYVMAAVDSATVIAVGDFLYLDTDDAKPAGDLADTGTEAGNQEAFHDVFLGVALDASADSETDPIRVATKGVFSYACPSGTFELGDLVGVDEAVSGTALEDQVVVSVAGENLAVGRVVVREPIAVTSVTIEIVSTIMYGGVQAMA